MTVRIAPSLLSADFARLADEVADVQRAGADLLHLDIMDGHFVPNLTFGPPIVKALATCSSIALDAHLMVVDPQPIIAELAAARTRRVAVHVEIPGHLHRILHSIREAGMQAGVAVNPASPLALLEEVIPWIDFVLVMSVNPGFGGQEFIPESLDKIRRLRKMALQERARRNKESHEIGEIGAIDITVDGGVGSANAASLAAAGATTLVAGTAVFGAENRAAAIKELHRIAAGGMQE